MPRVTTLRVIEHDDGTVSFVGLTAFVRYVRRLAERLRMAKIRGEGGSVERPN